MCDELNNVITEKKLSLQLIENNVLQFCYKNKGDAMLNSLDAVASRLQRRIITAKI